MQNSYRPSFFTLGLALFAMFFGAGNLIFPLYLGMSAQEHWLVGASGFGLTAVVAPLIGVLAMVIFKGNYAAFFDCFGKRGGLVAIFILLAVMIPLSSSPRCVMLAHSSLLPYLDTPPPFWLFSIAYCALIYLIVYQKSRMVGLLGRFLTPILLICLAWIVVSGIEGASKTHQYVQNSSQVFVLGLLEGYNTMDLLASFFFSASIIDLLRRSNLDEPTSLKMTLKASLVCTLLLGVVYAGLICLAADQADILKGVPREQQLVVIAKTFLGPQLGIVASIVIFLACLTPSVAMASVFAEFLADKVFGSREAFPLTLAITQACTFGMSIVGLEGIIFFTGPILQVFYPVLIILIVYNVAFKAQWSPLQVSTL